MIELASNALTIPERVMLLTDIPYEQYDAIVMLINQASASIETEMRRRLGKQSYSERVKPTGSQELILSQWPILEVRRVEIGGRELPPAAYSIEDGGVLYKDDGWPWRGYPYGLAYDPVMTSKNVLIEYTAGYILPKDATESEPATLPADIEGLCMEMVSTAYSKARSGGGAGLRAFSISDVHWEWAAETPASWTAVIERYRRMI